MLRLIRTPNIGPMTFSLLLQRYGSAIAALQAVPELAKRGGRILKPATRADAESEMAEVEAMGARLMFRGSDHYPNRLAQFDDAPPSFALLARSTSFSVHALPLLAHAMRRSMHNGLRYHLPKSWLRRAMSFCLALRAALMQLRIMVPLPAARLRSLQGESMSFIHQRMPISSKALLRQV